MGFYLHEESSERISLGSGSIVSLFGAQFSLQ